MQRIVRTVRAEQAPQDPWTMLDGAPEDAAAVLQVLGSYIGQRWPTAAEADFIVRVRSAFPDLDPGQLATLGPFALSGPRGLREVEEYLAFTPWRDDGAAMIEAAIERHIEPAYFWDARWVRAVLNGWRAKGAEL